MSSSNNFINKNLEEYLKNLCLANKDLSSLFTLEKDITNKAYKNISISLLQSSYFKFFLSVLNPSYILELGTFHGFSTISFAMFTNPDCEITTIDNNEENLKIAQQNFIKSKFENKITTVLNDATEQLEEYVAKKRKFDLIFIDANKSSSKQQLEISLKLISKNGVIILDNCLLSGCVFNPESNENSKKGKVFAKQAPLFDEINRAYFKNKNFSTTIIPFGDGCLMIKKL